MGLLEAGHHRVAYEGELLGRACEEFGAALNLLRRSHVDAPTVDLSNVSYISSRGVGLLLALRFDMLDQGRRLSLLASDRVWSLLVRVGVAHIFPERPGLTSPVTEAH
ncbi:MAG: STAS domain-containing protein [Planctomycetota bacterium]|jgi:anti-anti-sigma regulatory factor